jgi:hypothetical protein
LFFHFHSGVGHKKSSFRARVGVRLMAISSVSREKMATDLFPKPIRLAKRFVKS